jgi:hypothetical protein
MLAAWCVGRPSGMAFASLFSVGALLASGALVPREAGNAANDIAPVALLLASAALLINDPRNGWRASLPAALAAGLALGTKLTAAAPVAALWIGAVAIARRGERGARTAIWAAGLAATAGVWFLRNAVHSGNPFPWIDSLGPIGLPGPAGGFSGREPLSVSHYLLDTSLTVENDWFGPALGDAFGVAWPLLLAAALAGAGWSLSRRRPPAERVAGAAALAGLAAYLFTPLSAAGEEGAPIGFALNLRYAAPSLGIALALLPLCPPLRTRPGAASALLGAFVVSVALTAGEATEAWTRPEASVPASIAIVAVGGATGLVLFRIQRRGATARVAACAAALLVLVAAGRAGSESYLDDRYVNGAGYGLGGAAAWAQDEHDTSIALAGTTGAYLQYAFYDADLSNRVQWLGADGPRGGFGRIGDCEEFAVALEEGDFEFAVVTGDVDLDAPATVTPAPERAWLSGLEGATRVFSDPGAVVFALERDLGGGCGAAPGGGV